MNILDVDEDGNIENPLNLSGSFEGHQNRNVAIAVVLLFFTCTVPLVVLTCIPIWNNYRNKRRLRADAAHKTLTTTVAEQIQETYLMDLMKNYSMILSKSDVLEPSGEENADSAAEYSTITSSKSGSKPTADITNSSIRNDAKENDTSKLENDIEMQRPNDNNDENVHGVAEDNNHHQIIYVPQPGQKATATLENRDQMDGNVSGTNVRVARSGGCAVCLNDFCVDQIVTWSSNPDCSHVFHHRCLLEWYTAVGTQSFFATIRRGDSQGDSGFDLTDATIKKGICDFPILCPCCRQEYFLESKKGQQKS